MNIKELKKLIENMPDDCEMFVPSEDHGHARAMAYDTKVVKSIYSSGRRSETSYAEYYDTAKYPPESIVLRALVIT
jgi:hypothetical protein